jgi:hypothetical protein
VMPKRSFMRVARLATLALLFSQVGQETISIFIQSLKIGSVARRRCLNCCRLPTGLSTRVIARYGPSTLGADQACSFEFLRDLNFPPVSRISRNWVSAQS